MCFPVKKENDEMKKKEKSRGKKKLTGIVLSILFTALVPIGFVFLMGLLSESLPVLYFYTKQIFIAFIVLLIAGICMIIYQIFRYIKYDKKRSIDEDKQEERRLRREQRKAKELSENTRKHEQILSE